MYARKSYDTILVGDIYNHTIEGVCILADVTDYHYWFYAADIDAKYPANQDTPRAFKTEKLRQLDRPHVPVEIKCDAFEIDDLVYFILKGEVRWGKVIGLNGAHLIINDEGEHKSIHIGFCFQVLDGKKVMDAAAL